MPCLPRITPRAPGVIYADISRRPPVFALSISLYHVLWPARLYQGAPHHAAPLRYEATGDALSTAAFDAVQNFTLVLKSPLKK